MFKAGFEKKGGDIVCVDYSGNWEIVSLVKMVASNCGGNTAPLKFKIFVWWRAAVSTLNTVCFTGTLRINQISLVRV